MFDLNNFFNLLVELEYLLFCVFFSWNFPKRKSFFIRLAICLLLFLPMSFFSYEINILNKIFSQSINFILIFLSGTTTLFFLFDYNLASATFLSVISYSFRHCIYLVWILSCYILSDSFGIDCSSFSWIWIVVAIFCIAISLPFAILLFKRIKAYPDIALPPLTMILTSCVSLLIMIILNCFVLYYVLPKALIAIKYVLNLFALLSSFMVILILIGNIKQRKLESDISALNQIRYQEEKQYEFNKQSIDLINIKCHDLRHQIRNLKNSVSSINPEELENIEKAIRIYDTRMKTGNASLDLILQEKSLLCNQKGIAFDCIIDGQILSFMKDSDIYSLFGNIIDNAMEACMQIKNQEKRTISLKVKKIANGVFAYEENPYEGEIQFQDGLPTSKKDQRYHGFGMKSIANIVKLYQGNLSIKAEDNRYTLSLFFPKRN